MGILDDAIRQHLELKRQHGADDTDLERLEQEAFGPATRPGDPEFETGEGPATGGEQASDPETIADFDGGDELFSEAPTTVAPQAGAASAPSEAPSAPDAGPPSSAPETGGADAPAAAEVPPEPTPTEQARVEHPHLADTVDHPALEQPLPDAPPPSEAPSAVDPEPVEAPEDSIFFDQEADEADESAAAEAEPPPAAEAPPAADDEVEEVAFEDFELDADAEAAERAVQPPPEPGEGTVTQVPFEPASGESAAEPGAEEDDFDLDLDLEDEPFDEGPPAAATPPTSAPPEPAAEVEFELDDDLEDEIEDDDEDLLEETPDFLQDAPEGERLWFEQGEPKDFDFDD